MKIMKIFLIMVLIFLITFIIYTVYDMNRKKIFYLGSDIEKYKILGTETYNEKIWKSNKEIRKRMLYSYLKEKKYENEKSYETTTYFPAFQDKIKSVLDMGNVNGKKTYLVIDTKNCFQLVPNDNGRLRYVFYYEYYKRKRKLNCDYIYDPYTVRIFSW